MPVSVRVNLYWEVPATGDAPTSHNVKINCAGVERHVNSTPIAMPQTTYSVSFNNVNDGNKIEAWITPVNSAGPGVPLYQTVNADVVSPPDAPINGTITVTQV